MRTGLAALALFSLVAGNCRAENVFVNLRPEAEIDRTEVRLADIAEIVTRDVSNSEQLGATVVGKCPNLTSPCRLTKTEIASAIQARAVQPGTFLLWGANEAVTIRGRKHPASLTPAIEQTAIRILQQLDQGFPLAVGWKDEPTSIDVPPGVAEFRPEFDQLRWVGGKIELPINVLVGGTSVAKPMIHYVLRRGVTGTKPEAALVPDAARSEARHMPSPRSVGAVSRTSQVEEPSSEQSNSKTIVAKNEKVRLLIDSGPLRVEAEGVALADAGLGGAVRVRRANGLADVSGRAINRGTVLVGEN